MADDPYQAARERFAALSDREQVRERAPMWIGNVDARGLFRLFRTVFANALAEYALDHATTIAVTLYRDGSVAIVDNGSGLPITPDAATDEPGILRRLTYRRRQDAPWPYRIRNFAGWHHTELACVNFLSSQFDVVSRRGGETFARRFRQGVEQPDRPAYSLTTESGTYIFWTADPEIFASPAYSAEEIKSHLHEQAYLYPGVRIEWRDESSGDQCWFYEPHGIGALLKWRIAGKELLHPPLCITLERDGDVLDFACVFTASVGMMLTFANTQSPSEHGYFLRAFQRGASRVLRVWALRLGLLDRKRRRSPNGIDRQLHAIFAFQLRFPIAAGMCWQHLGSPEAEPLAYAAGKLMMRRLTEEYPDAAAQVVQRACRTTRAELAE